jgi:hypothetical protein
MGIIIKVFPTASATSLLSPARTPLIPMYYFVIMMTTQTVTAGWQA